MADGNAFKQPISQRTPDNLHLNCFNSITSHSTLPAQTDGQEVGRERYQILFNGKVENDLNDSTLKQLKLTEMFLHGRRSQERLKDWR